MSDKTPKLGDQKRDGVTLSMRATLAPSTANAEKRTVEVVWTTGAKVLRNGWDGSFYEELSLDPAHVRMGRLNNGAPFLADHNGYRVADTLGVVESAKLGKDGGTAVIRFATAGTDANADMVFRKIQDGIIQNVSVGYRVLKFEKTETADEKVPTYRATDWEPYEISAVAMGADDQAGFRNLSRVTPQESSNMSDEVKTTGTPVPATDTEATRAADLKAAADAAVKADRERAEEIRVSVRAAKLGDDLANEMITKGLTADAARKLVLEKLAAKDESVRTDNYSPATSVDDSLEKFARGAMASIIVRSSDNCVLEAKRMKLPGFADLETDPGEFRGWTLIDLMREHLERRGVNLRGKNKGAIIDLAMTTRAGGLTPASDFPVLYESILHKTLLGAYLVQNDTWTRFCKQEEVSDFRPSNRYRVGSFGTMDIVPEGEEFKNKAIPDGLKRTISTQTKGNMISMSRQAIINDDMGANLDLAARFGRGFKLTIEKEVYALLAQNAGLGPTDATTSLPFFDAGNVNIGTGAALTVASIDADRQVLENQLDISSNDYLGLKPRVLLVPVSLESQAKIINTAAYDFTGTALMKPNVMQNLFGDVVSSPRLTGTRRYLFADPGEAPAIIVAFLAQSGREPFLEQRLGWRTDGIEWKARLDFLAQMFDPKGAVTNAGA